MEGNRVIDNEKLQEIESKVRKVLDYHLPETITINLAERESINFFYTEPGKLLANQIDGLLDFTERLGGLALVPKLISSSKKFLLAEKAGEIEGITQSDLHQFDFSALYKPKISKEDKECPEETFEIDLIWIVSLVAFSLHAYLEVYASSILEQMLKNEKMVEKIEKYLEMEAKKRSDKSREPILKASGMNIFGLKTKLRTFEQANSINTILCKLIGEEEYGVYIKAFKKYLDIRHKIAHRNPLLAPDEYTTSDFELDIGEFDARIMPRIIKETTHFREGVEEFARGLFEMSKIQGKITSVVQMAVMYPALLDCVLSTLLSATE